MSKYKLFTFTPLFGIVRSYENFSLSLLLVSSAAFAQNIVNTGTSPYPNFQCASNLPTELFCAPVLAGDFQANVQTYFKGCSSADGLTETDMIANGTPNGQTLATLPAGAPASSAFSWTVETLLSTGTDATSPVGYKYKGAGQNTYARYELQSMAGLPLPAELKGKSSAGLFRLTTTPYVYTSSSSNGVSVNLEVKAGDTSTIYFSCSVSTTPSK